VRWTDVASRASPRERREYEVRLEAFREAWRGLKEARRARADAVRAAEREVHQRQVAVNAAVRAVARRLEAGRDRPD
jgi:hypothetical protein